jgi:ketosteroid isomerase-like protein
LNGCFALHNNKFTTKEKIMPFYRRLKRDRRPRTKDHVACTVCFIVLCFAGFLFPHILSAEDPSREVQQTEDLRINSLLRNDIPSLDRILSDDLTYAHSTGKVEHKREFLSLLASGRLRYKEFQCSDVQIRVYGNAAVVTGKADIHVEFEGKANHVLLRYTAVYARTGGSWQMVAWQSTKIPE